MYSVTSNHNGNQDMQTTIQTMNYSVLTISIFKSVYTFSILFSIHFLRCWQGEFVEQSKASLAGDHFLYSQEIRCASLLWVKRLNCVQWGFSHSWLVFFFKAHEQSWSILGIHGLLNFVVVRKHTYPVWHRACLNSHSEDTNHPEKQYTLSLSSQFP